MTVLSYIKGVLILVSLFGVVFLGIGAWRTWSAYSFAKTALKLEGTFKGYYTVSHEERVEDMDGYRRTAKVSESLPMYVYTDAKGRTRDVTGSESHFFKHLKYGQKVVVLVSPEDSGTSRLGDLISLYGNGFLNGLVGIGIFLLGYYGIKASKVLLGTEGALRRLGQSRLPIGDMVIIIGGFLLLAGVLMFLGYRFAVKRQDPALLKALEAGDHTLALALATDGRGIDVKSAAGETSVIVALKAGQPQVARAILNHLWVNGNVYCADRIPAAQLAAQLKDAQTLKLLITKNASTVDIDPEVVRELVAAGENATVKLIIENGYDLHRIFDNLTLGDLALLHGSTDLVRLIHDRQGAFRAPEPFVALALGDAQALAAALDKPGARKRRFRNFTLEQYAQKVGQSEMIP